MRRVVSHKSEGGFLTLHLKTLLVIFYIFLLQYQLTENMNLARTFILCCGICYVQVYFMICHDIIYIKKVQNL